MSNEFEKALDAEIAGLEAALKADPRFLKLEDAKRLRALYTATPLADRPARVSSAPTTRSTPRSPANQAILDCAAEMLVGRTTPTSTSESPRRSGDRLTPSFPPWWPRAAPQILPPLPRTTCLT